MSDAHTHWIAPFWEEIASPKTSAVEGPRVWVMNPGMKPAKVVSVLYDMFGSGLDASTHDIEPRATDLTIGGLDGSANGWCGVTSDVPVLPWGVTQFKSGDAAGWANMTFFRVDPFDIKIDPGRLKQLLERRPPHR